jgi:hypothetical protein
MKLLRLLKRKQAQPTNVVGMTIWKNPNGVSGVSMCIEDPSCRGINRSKHIMFRLEFSHVIYIYVISFHHYIYIGICVYHICHIASFGAPTLGSWKSDISREIRLEVDQSPQLWPQSHAEVCVLGLALRGRLA